MKELYRAPDLCQFREALDPEGIGSGGTRILCRTAERSEEDQK